MTTRSKLLACLPGAVAAMSLAATGANAQCVFTPPLTTQTKCVTAIAIPGNPLRSFDISFVNEKRAEYYFADRSNSAVQVIDIKTLTWKRSLGGFVGVALSSPNPPPHGTVNNNKSGPDGVTSHGRWLYAGDGDSTLKVFDLEAPPAIALKQVVPTGGTTRVDEMALTSNGKLILAANNAEDPPFATLMHANGNAAKSNVSIISRITVSNAIVPAGFGLSLEQPAWDPGTKRFYTSIPVIANNPTNCNYGQLSGPITCDGGVLVVDPKTITTPTVTLGAFDPTTNTGVIALHACGPNGSTVGPNENILLGCTPQNNPSDVITLVLNAVSRVQTPIVHITGSDEVWFNDGDNRYYTGSSRDCTVPGGPCPAASQQTAVLGVIDAGTNLLIEKVPQSSNSHSVAADAKHNFIFVPQVAPAAVVGSGGDTTTVGAGICGTSNGCVAVFQHKVQGKDDVAENE
ncbi:MAG TPA: hypothetical protein VGX95_04165 [Xanthobacteraceae bacterium]|jgi:hypothetical protein|nr:hypothetical protein [Xanthobacteraceae bacterium]